MVAHTPRQTASTRRIEINRQSDRHVSVLRVFCPHWQTARIPFLLAATAAATATAAAAAALH